MIASKTGLIVLRTAKRIEAMLKNKIKPDIKALYEGYGQAYEKLNILER